ncbi:MAG: hypothetical protein KGH58_01110 [Candidatus Micrarchaeota archaeon]|nr:hypothetical protein [Candidatus Micrarchaeota archaeon]
MYKEGKARITTGSDAFLNPEARLSRDISVGFVKAFGKKGDSLLDATAATGIRGIRYGLETSAKRVTLLDINKKAYKVLAKNVKANKLKATVLNKSIQEFANTTDEKFNFIDLDPFGGAAPNIFDLMKLARDGTYMMITGTDTAVLCGAQHKACIRIYDARPMHNELCHEAGVRILIGYVARVAAQFGFGVRVLLAFSYLHYMRIMIRMEHGAERASSSVESLGHLYYCNNCTNMECKAGFFAYNSDCPLCKSRYEIAGKMWTGSIYDSGAVGTIKKYFEGNVDDKAELRFIETLAGEPDVPFYHSIPRLTRKMSMSAVSPARIAEALRKRGYSAAQTHMEKSCIKTDAPLAAIKEAMRSLQK